MALTRSVTRALTRPLTRDINDSFWDVPFIPAPRDEILRFNGAALTYNGADLTRG